MSWKLSFKNTVQEEYYNDNTKQIIIIYGKRSRIGLRTYGKILYTLRIKTNLVTEKAISNLSKKEASNLAKEYMRTH